MFLTHLIHHIELSAPLFLLVLAGYLVMRVTGWPTTMADMLTKFVFNVAMPALLFHLMCGFSKLPSVDVRLLLVYFGGCLITFTLARLIAWKVFRLDGTAQSVFGLGGIFSNNVLLGVPLAKLTMGAAAMPSVALVITFNALTLWTIVTVSVEWARNGELSVKGFGKTMRSVLTNPLIIAILSGMAFSQTGLELPQLLEMPLALASQATAPLALITLGMGLAEYGIRQGWQQSIAISLVKLVMQPLVVWLLALLIGLPPLETRVAVVLASLSTGFNVYLMSRQFKAVEGPVASALVLTTLLAAITVPLVLAMTEAQ